MQIIAKLTLYDLAQVEDNGKKENFVWPGCSKRIGWASRVRQFTPFSSLQRLKISKLAVSSKKRRFWGFFDVFLIF